MMILNLSKSLAKPLVMAKLNMAYLSSFKKPSKTAVVLIAGVTISFCARRSVMMILNLSKSLAKPLGHGKTEHGIFVKFKKPSKTAVVLIAGVTISFCARRSVMMILNLSKSLAKPLVMAKLNMAYLSSLKKPSKTAVVLIAGVTISFCARRSVMMDFKLIKITCQAACHGKTEHGICCPHCRCHHLGYSVPPAHHRTIWCRSTFGPRGPGLSNPTSFLRPALPMAPTTDNNARDERSVPRPNPATFLRDFTLYMTSKDAIL